MMFWHVQAAEFAVHAMLFDVSTQLPLLLQQASAVLHC